MAEQLMSRGGAVSPEDHAWVNKLLAAYHDTSEVADDASSNHGLPDPWAEDTQPEVFQAPQAINVSADATEEPKAEDSVEEAQRLRAEARTIRDEFRRLVVQRRVMRGATTDTDQRRPDRPGLW